MPPGKVRAGGGVTYGRDRTRRKGEIRPTKTFWHAGPSIWCGPTGVQRFVRLGAGSKHCECYIRLLRRVLCWHGHPLRTRASSHRHGTDGHSTHRCRWDTRTLYWGASYLSQASLTLTGPVLRSSGAVERCASNGTKQHQRVCAQESATIINAGSVHTHIYGPRHITKVGGGLGVGFGGLACDNAGSGGPYNQLDNQEVNLGNLERYLCGTMLTPPDTRLMWEGCAGWTWVGG